MAEQLEHALLEREGALGGAPLIELPSLDGEHKRARKRRKREAKLRQNGERPPDSFERFRILAELVKEGRQIIDLVDHRARYALVVIGVLNTGVFLVLSRGHLFAGGASVSTCVDERRAASLRRCDCAVRVLRRGLLAAAPHARTSNECAPDGG